VVKDINCLTDSLMTSPDTTYTLQKLALAPFTDLYSEKDLLEQIAMMSVREKNDFLSCVSINRLVPAWINLFGVERFRVIFSAEYTTALENEYRMIAMRYLQQKATLLEFSALLELNSIPHAVFKGAHSREIVYPAAATRASSDIDILIDENNREEVVRLAAAADYTLTVSEANATHQVSLSKGITSIDLHWHILRPGRVPKSFTADLLHDRVKQKGYWSLSNEKNMFILLIHPVFTEYSLATKSRLDLFLDLIYWFKQEPIKWGEVLRLLEETGLRSAAWITLTYLNILAGVALPQQIMDDITPGRARRWYLQKWIHTDLPARYRSSPFLAKTGFTLFAHDSIRHALRFLWILFADRSRKTNSGL
jgi:hypothetical protein